jgi:hypothetical protein
VACVLEERQELPHLAACGGWAGLLTEWHGLQSRRNCDVPPGLPESRSANHSVGRTGRFAASQGENPDHLRPTGHVLSSRLGISFLRNSSRGVYSSHRCFALVRASSRRRAPTACDFSSPPLRPGCHGVRPPRLAPRGQKTQGKRPLMGQRKTWHARPSG